MKKALLKMAAIAGILSGSTMFAANYDDPVLKDEKMNFFVGYELGVGSQEDKKIFGEQPVKELVGDRTVEHTLKIGLTNTFKEGESRARIYGIVWKTPDANDEIGFGIGGAYIASIKNTNLGFLIAGEIGYGWQETKNKSVILSTNANKVGYIMGKQVSHGTFQGRFLEDNALIRINLQLGLSYRVSKNLSVDCKYQLSRSSYDISYYIEGINSLNSITKDLYAHTGVIAINFHF